MTQASEFLTEMDEVVKTLRVATSQLSSFREQMQQSGREIRTTGTTTRQLQRDLKGLYSAAFDDLLINGPRVSDLFKNIFQSTILAATNAAVQPVSNAFGNALGGAVGDIVGGVLPFAQGGAFSKGKVMPFARGGVFDRPVTFPMGSGSIGLMGEAGPEAIMPLSRGADGKLGVRAQSGNRPMNVTINVSTPDVQGFRKSQSQLAAQIGRALRQGGRNT